MIKYVPQTQGPPVIKAANSNQISDAYRDSIVIAYQYFGNVLANCDFELNGVKYDTPIMAGPIGLRTKGPASGMLGYAEAVTKAGSLYWADFHDPEAWEKVMEHGCHALRVIKPLADTDEVIAEVKKDTAGGAYGYAMDVDHGISVYGERDIPQGKMFDSQTVESLKRINDASDLPFYLKGILSVHDALIAKEVGVAGIVVSGHNNRYPCTVPPLKMLPIIREAVGNDMKIFVDGGMNNGFDVFKALALGADGVLSARTLCGAFIKDGEEGLTRKIGEMTAELTGAMSNTGSPDLKHINRDSLIFM